MNAEIPQSYYIFYFKYLILIRNYVNQINISERLKNQLSENLDILEKSAVYKMIDSNLTIKNLLMDYIAFNKNKKVNTNQFIKWSNNHIDNLINNAAYMSSKNKYLKIKKLLQDITSLYVSTFDIMFECYNILENNK